MHRQYELYLKEGVITGGGGYSNTGFDKQGDEKYREWDRILEGFIGAKLGKTPFLKQDLSHYISIKELKKILLNLSEKAIN